MNNINIKNVQRLCAIEQATKPGAYYEGFSF